MVSLYASSIAFVACALSLQELAMAAPCGAENYSTVAAATQSLNVNCASWAAYLASGGVWHCDSTCYQSIAKLVDTLPDCEFGGPYGPNYKVVLEGLVTNCEAELLSSSSSTDQATATLTTANSKNASEPTATSAIVDSSNASSSDVITEAPANTDISTTSSANKQSGNTATQLAAVVLFMVGMLLQ